jgi:hypothetical protein
LSALFARFPHSESNTVGKESSEISNSVASTTTFHGNISITNIFGMPTWLIYHYNTCHPARFINIKQQTPHTSQPGLQGPNIIIKYLHCWWTFTLAETRNDSPLYEGMVRTLIATGQDSLTASIPIDRLLIIHNIVLKPLMLTDAMPLYKPRSLELFMARVPLERPSDINWQHKISARHISMKTEDDRLKMRSRKKTTFWTTSSSKMQLQQNGLKDAMTMTMWKQNHQMHKLGNVVTMTILLMPVKHVEMKMLMPLNHVETTLSPIALCLYAVFLSFTQSTFMKYLNEPQDEDEDDGPSQQGTQPCG